MLSSSRLLGHSVGNLSASLMFVGEAPGRLGADQTHIPFHGDAAGRNFEDLIAFAGITRDEIYVTNAVLCNPRDERGNNATPNNQEIANCSGYLRRQIELVQPKIVVTLGAIALRAVAAVEDHGLVLSENVRTSHQWFGRLLLPLYHPGQRAMVHRSYANQRSDYQFVAETLRKTRVRGKADSGVTRGEVLEACRYVLRKRGEVSYFELHKLAYLAEYTHVRRTGHRLTKAFFIRQKDGPYCVDLNLQRLKRSTLPLAVSNRSGKLMLRLEGSDSADLFGNDEEPTVSEEMRETLETVLERYQYPNDAELKQAVYLTAPMRSMLRREKLEGANLYNAPIDFMGNR